MRTYWNSVENGFYDELMSIEKSAGWGTAALNYARRGISQVGGLFKNRQAMLQGLKNTYAKGSGVPMGRSALNTTQQASTWGGVKAVAKKFAPGAAVVGAPIVAAGTLGYVAAGPNR